jgi:hypothetical protein
MTCARFFGAEASTLANRQSLEKSLSRDRHHDVDIRDAETIDALFKNYGSNTKVSFVLQHNLRTTGLPAIRLRTLASMPTVP